MAETGAEREAHGEGSGPSEEEPASFTPIRTARGLLGATRTGADPDSYLSALAEFDEHDLRAVRDERDAALAFWTNLYNAGTQLLLDRRPGLYEHPLRVVRFFATPCLTVGGQSLSLDDIEQGILRGSRSKYTLGYTPRLLPDSFELRYAFDDPDPRIHFALNCGAASCPAIRAYEAERIGDQLDRATAAYLEETVEYDAGSGVVRVPRVFLWYRGDFGGGRGIRTILREYDILATDERPKVRYLSWDWSCVTGKFME